MKKRPLLASAAFAFIGVMAAAPAVAQPLSGLEGLGKPVSDSRLGTMRGKFVAPSGIAYFGIAMASSWQGADGITTSANLLFSIDFADASGQVTPRLMISWSRECDTCGDSSMDLSGFGPAASNSYVALTGNGASIPVGSLDSATGAVQTQQIAGSDNVGRNVMSIEIVPAASIVNDTSGMTALTGPGSQVQQFSDGDTLQFNFSAHGLGIAMTDQNGALKQGVNGDLGQLTQHVMIDGNGIVAGNDMKLVIGMDPAAAAQHLNIQGALSAMKGMGY
jgi:hypothetical protein